jgi:hypothetical protein
MLSLLVQGEPEACSRPLGRIFSMLQLSVMPLVGQAVSSRVTGGFVPSFPPPLPGQTSAAGQAEFTNRVIPFQFIITPYVRFVSIIPSGGAFRGCLLVAILISPSAGGEVVMANHFL